MGAEGVGGEARWEEVKGRYGIGYMIGGRID